MNRLKTLLVGINAKYIHSNPAVRYIQKYAGARGHYYHVCEYTINQPVERIIADIYKQRPDILGFSCYIWNIGVVGRLVETVKKILPDTVVVLGGPEITEASAALGADYTIEGEGEKRFFGLVSALEDGRAVPGKTPESGGSFDFRETVFPYDDADFEELKNRIIYYEAQRGCPFKCAYCLSSGGGVRRLPLERVCRELSVFIEKRVTLVKFVDRTFNCREGLSRSIWNHLIENDNGVTGFHFEILAELLAEEDFALLKKARKGLFQFEIGVQSTNTKTLSEIERFSDFARLAGNVGRLLEAGNIRLHLDLIAGLPYEGLNSFKKSVNSVLALNPDVLQMGFLKALKGSKIRENAEKYGLVFDSRPPYEVLYTNDISFGELRELKNAEHMLETYYNSGLARHSVEYLAGFFETPFDFFMEFGSYWDKHGYFGFSHGKPELYVILYEFFKGARGEEGPLKDVIVYDMLLNDNVKALPQCLNKPSTKERERYIRELYRNPGALAKIDERLSGYDARRMRRSCNVCFFDYAVNGNFEKRETAVLFHYLSGKGTPHTLEREAKND